MRRSVVIYLCGVFIMLILSGVFTWINNENTGRRYHQHLNQPSETELIKCRVCDGTELCTHLPVICIDTGGQKIPGRPVIGGDSLTYELSDDGLEDIIVNMAFISEDGVWHHADDTPTDVSQARFRIRGDSSRWFSKASYRLILTENDKPEDKKPLPLLGMPASSEWALYGPFLDKTLIRNYMWMNLSAEIMGNASEVRFCEVMLDGEYQGLYVLMEMIEMREGKVSLTPYKEGDLVMSYLVRLNYYSDSPKVINDFGFYTYKWDTSSVEVLYPGTRYQNDYVLNFINADLSEFQKRLFSTEMLTGTKAYENYIYVDSFVDMYIIMEFLAETDFFMKSTYLYKDVRGKLHIGPVWDFNNVLNNARVLIPREGFFLYNRNWYERLMMDSSFVDRIIRRYRELRRGILSEENLIQYIKEVEIWLGGAVERNFDIWGYSFDPSTLTEDERRIPDHGSTDTIYDVNPSSYSEAMEWMLDYMIGRGRWLDEYIEALRQYGHPSRSAAWTLD